MPDKLGISRQVPEELGKSPSRGYPGNEAKACLSEVREEGRNYGCSMWRLLPLSALLLFSSFAVTVCEDQKEANDGSIVRARLEVSVNITFCELVLKACLHGKGKVLIIESRSKLCL